MTDGTTTKTINVTTAFDQGAWMHFPISVPAGGHVDITADRTAGSNVLLNGIFLGGAGAAAARATPTPSPEPRTVTITDAPAQCESEPEPQPVAEPSHAAV